MPYYTFVFSLHFLLSFCLSFLFFSTFYFSLLSMFLAILPCSPNVVYYAQLRPSYTAYRDKIYRFTPQLLLAYCGCPSQATHQSVGYPATTTTLCQLHHVSFPNKGSFVLFSYFPWHSYSDKSQVFFFINSYGMHLVIPAHLFLFSVIYHPSRTFPPKEPEQESQNRLLPSPHRQTIPFLTSDPQPIAPVLAGYKWVVLEPCACPTPI